LPVSESFNQFTGPDLVVGNNATGTYTTAYGLTWPVSGDLTGTITAEESAVTGTWEGLSEPKGYVVDVFAFEDQSSNTFRGLMLADLDYDSEVTASGYMVGISGTGSFSGQKLIGRYYAYSDGTGSATLRRYSAPEVSPPQAFGGALTLRGFGAYPIGQSATPVVGDEELVQFTRENMRLPYTSLTVLETRNYLDGPMTGALAGTMYQSGDVCGAFLGNAEPITPAGGWHVGKFFCDSGSGTIGGVVFGDSWSGKSAHDYMFALSEDATGSYSGRDYFATATVQASGDPVTASLNGYLYAMTLGTTVATATGTGTAGFVPTAGTMGNLIAVHESSMPKEGKPDLEFPDGFFEFQITGLTPGESVTLTITLPSPVPTAASYWKYGPTPGDATPHWYQIPMGDNDGDNVITITLTDGGWGDDDLTADGTIIDQGGPGWPGPSGGGGVPVFPSIFAGIAAALGAGVLAYLLSRRLRPAQ
jgi:hypothetical protein